jgi:TRAP-type C4-dicarboxylate transport system permease large subunit
MSETIPPSLVLITIGSVTGVSIAALFTGGLLPALVAALALVVVAGFRSRGESLAGVRRAGAAQIARTFVIALPALALPFLIRAAVVEGVATATEVSTVGVVYTMLAGIFLYRQFDWRRLYPMLVETASLSGAILLIIGMATAMAWALTQSGFSHQLVTTMAGLPGGHAGFLAVSIVTFVVLGSVLEGIPAIVLFGPLRAAFRRRLLRGVRDRPRLARRGDGPGLALSRRPRPRAHHRRRAALAVGRLSRALGTAYGIVVIERRKTCAGPCSASSSFS